MGLFAKKVTLEDFVSTVVRTAFEYPSDKNIKKVDADNLLSNKEVSRLKECIPSFIIAVNSMLIMLAAEQGVIKRFKGDSNYEVSKTVGYALAVTTGGYLEYKGSSKQHAADISEAICSKAFEYLEIAENKLGDNSKIDDIFFEFCTHFRSQVLEKMTTDEHDKAFVVFDFAKQLYRNIRTGFGSLKIE